MRARTYDPVTDQFLTVDPLRGTSSGETYSCAADNPINRLDPAGLSSIGTACGCCPPDRPQNDATATPSPVPPNSPPPPQRTIEPLKWYNYPVVRKTIKFAEMASVILSAGEDLPLLAGAEEFGGAVLFDQGAGHGARHLVGTGLQQTEVEATIEAQVRQQVGQSTSGSFGVGFQYRDRPSSTGHTRFQMAP
jgi:hypothetical protein